MRTPSFAVALIVAASTAAGAQGPFVAFQVSANSRAYNGTLEREADAVRTPVLPEPRPGAAAEPADSLYRLARAALNDADYRLAATLFQTVVDRYPDSGFAPDALYYRAYALYKIGNSRELELAVQSLDRQVARYPKAGTLNDAKQLRASILSEQARRGDSNAARTLGADIQQLRSDGKCPTEDDDMRMIAIAGVIQQDPDLALPVLQKVLERKDECSI
ncbi:MAG: tetratricopeptide repeat protein, partial [Gemmatimonadaceae bacterium]